jgi:hypothetical protein
VGRGQAGVGRDVDLRGGGGGGGGRIDDHGGLGEGGGRRRERRAVALFLRGVGDRGG